MDTPENWESEGAICVDAIAAVVGSGEGYHWAPTPDVKTSIGSLLFVRWRLKLQRCLQIRIHLTGVGV
ncbi:MAG: hypothetical protein JXR76_32770, partial [Deltaproteobacteria bacterium]|nr:hypothetical protein [Deltaproteobacteria bacterium]